MTGQVHSAGYYADDGELRGLVASAAGGGGPVIVVHQRAEELRGWLPETVVFLEWAEVYASPARAIATLQRAFDGLLGGGAGRVGVVGAAPVGGFGWDRYEAAVNLLWRDYPLDTLCLYQAPAPGLRDVIERTHPAAEAAVNPRYDPAFVCVPTPPDPVEAGPPLVSLANPTPAQARSAVQAVAAGRLSEPVTEDLVFAASEATTNAQVHGSAPWSVLVWGEPARVVVRVTDAGAGPVDPFAGLTPAPRDRGGLGLWLTHQLDVEIALLATPADFTVRLRAGTLA